MKMNKEQIDAVWITIHDADRAYDEYEESIPIPFGTPGRTKDQQLHLKDLRNESLALRASLNRN